MPALALSLALLMLATPPELRAQVRDPWSEDGVANMATTSQPATVAAIALSIRSRAIQDSRCYLMNGGAVESFFISEDSPVGSIIGTLSVNGDPDPDRGDITLRVQETGAGVSLAAGSKNLTLTRALDRERVKGPASVYVNVRCDRRHSADPSFVIPVSVRVWDVNDNAPAWAGAPYRARLSELAAAGARVLPAPRAADADQPGPHATVRYSVLPGPHSEYFKFANELDGTLVINKPLDYETARSLHVRLRAEDGGSPPLHNDTDLYVEVLDADDQNPAFTSEHYTAVVPDDAQEGTILTTSPGPVRAADQDLGINAPLHYSAAGDARRLVAVARDTGAVAVTKELLGITQPVTVVIKAVQVDNPDRYALATLTISPRPASTSPSPSPPPAPSPSPSPSPRGVRFTRGAYAAAVSEAAPPGTVITALNTVPPAGETPLQFYVSERSFLEKFAISAAGEVVLRRGLDYEERDSYLYQVMVTDGQNNDTASLNITVLNENEWEPRFRYPQYEFRVDGAGAPGGDAGAPGGDAGAPGGDGGLLPVGTLDVFDGDKADTVTLSLRGPDADMFYMSPSGGVFLRSAALAANSSALHVLATATDSGRPPRQTSVPVTVHLTRPHHTKPSNGGIPAVAGGAAALLVLLCALLLYLHRRRKRRSKPSPSTVGAPYLAHEKRPTSPTAPGAPAVPPAPLAGPPAGSGSLQSVSAGASTILANSSSSLDIRDGGNGTSANGAATRQSGRSGRSKVAPTPPPGGPPSAGAPALMSDHLHGAAGRSGVAWPSATIPARVKKLSWDDAADCCKDSAGEAVEATHPALQDHMNLTVYF